MWQDNALRTQVLQEITEIPENKLLEIYRFLHPSSKTTKRKNKDKKKSFAGIWKDLSDEVFNQFINDIANRRKIAFSGRKLK